jgi:hypothetical protein
LFKRTETKYKGEIKLKKRIFIPVLLAIALLLSMGGVALAGDPTTVDVTWDGTGYVDTEVNTGDAHAGFMTGGDGISGTYTATDSNDNPYNYQVDSFSAVFTGHVVNGGMFTGCDRTDSYNPMYGPAGQESYSIVTVEDGWADMAYRTTTNFAQMRDCSYGYQLPGGHNIVLDAAFYYIDRYIGDNRGESGEFEAWGTGAATLDCMSAEASGNWALKLGCGCGCYTDANYNATGAGHVEVTGTGNNGVTFNGMGVSTGGGTLQFIADWLGNISIGDYSLTAW